MAILHHARTLQALQPLYVTRFSCIGPECEDNCCGGWKIGIDKKTYDAYDRITHPGLGTRMTENVTRDPNPGHDLLYARIDLKGEDQKCSLLDGELCSVHKTMGSTFLSHTCFTYPRVASDFGGQFEQALELSCPEAARQALLPPDAFDFVEAPITVRMEVVKKVRATDGLSPELMNDLRIFCINLIRTKGLELWQRLAILGVFCERATPLLANRDNDALRALLESVVALIEQGQVLDALADLQPDHAAQAMVFSTLWRGISFVSSSPTRAMVIAAVAEGLGADPHTGSVSAERLVECYSRGVRRLPEALRSAPHLLEHYLLNEIYRNVFPFDTASPYASYLRLVSRFGLLRLMLAARSNTDGALPDAAALVDTVRVHSRRFEHDHEFARQVHEALATSGWASLEKLYSFLRH